MRGSTPAQCLEALMGGQVCWPRIAVREAVGKCLAKPISARAGAADVGAEAADEQGEQGEQGEQVSRVSTCSVLETGPCKLLHQIRLARVCQARWAKQHNKMNQMLLCDRCLCGVDHYRRPCVLSPTAWF